jgi:hypothetical protein
MKVTITLKNKTEYELEYPFILFGARNNYISCNYGNRIGKEILKIEFDDEYKEYIGVSNETNKPDNIYYSAFLMDLTKYNFLVVSVNGKLERRFSDNGKSVYKDISPFNPYSNIYEYYSSSFEEKIVIELIKPI